MRESPTVNEQPEARGFGHAQGRMLRATRPFCGTEHLLEPVGLRGRRLAVAQRPAAGRVTTRRVYKLDPTDDRLKTQPSVCVSHPRSSFCAFASVIVPAQTHSFSHVSKRQTTVARGRLGPEAAGCGVPNPGSACNQPDPRVRTQFWHPSRRLGCPAGEQPRHAVRGGAAFRVSHP